MDSLSQYPTSSSNHLEFPISDIVVQTEGVENFSVDSEKLVQKLWGVLIDDGLTFLQGADVVRVIDNALNALSRGGTQCIPSDASCINLEEVVDVVLNDIEVEGMHRVNDCKLGRIPVFQFKKRAPSPTTRIEDFLLVAFRFCVSVKLSESPNMVDVFLGPLAGVDNVDIVYV